MSISVTGLGSGLDYDTWIEELVALKQEKINAVSAKATTATKQQTALSGLKDSYTALQDAITKFTDALSFEDVFNQKTATSSSDAVTASVTTSSSAQTVKVAVSQLATATTAKSSSAVASYVDSNTTLSSIGKGSIEAGTFSVYVDGTKSTVNITSDEQMSKVLEDLNAISGVSATISEDGKLTIEASGSSTVTVGSSSDTSNFGDVMSLVKNSDTGAYSSSKSIFDTDTAAALTSTTFASGTVTAGKFTIGDTEFEVTSSKSLDDIIDEINASDCGATASWDPNSGKLALEATDEGAVNINICSDVANGGSNFTSIMGFTAADGQSLTTDSQTLGTNAILTINGTQITSSSNTVTSAISGIEGLTLTLNDKTSSTASVAIEQDTEGISEAITTFVNAFNTVISNTDTATASGGKLNGETVLNSLRNKLRTLVTSSVTGENGYTSLASAGITTGAFTTDTSAKTNQLVIDTDALTAALKADPEAIKKLLMGDSTTSTEGVFDKLETVLDNALNTTSGYFETRDESFEKQIDRINDKVDRMNLDLKNYEDMLDAKFEAMDTLISSLKSQASVFDSYFNKDNSDDNS